MMAKNRKYYFMYLTAIVSSFAVVVLHTVSNPVQLGLKIRPSFYVLLCIILGIIFSYGVPIFFMQSGANILNYRERYNTKTFFIKRVHKVVIPFITWSLLGFFLIYGKSNLALNPKIFIKTFLTGSIVGPYWFFYNIIGFYLCVPFISLILSKGSRSLIRYMLVILVLINTGLPIINIITKTQNLFAVSIPFIGPYAQYFIAGWYLVNEKISIKRKRQIYVIAIIMIIVEIYATIYFSFFTGHISSLNYPDGIVKSFYDIAMFPSFCVMCALFLLFKSFEGKLQQLSKKNYLKVMASLTFGIYLIHPFVITWILNPFNNLFAATPLIIKIIIDPIFVYIVSGIVTWGIRNLNYLKWLVP